MASRFTRRIAFPESRFAPERCDSFDIATQAIAGHELFTADPDFDEIAKIAPLKLFRLDD